MTPPVPPARPSAPPPFPHEVRLVRLPRLLTPEDLAERSVVVFDALRATSTMATALANGASRVHIVGDLESARQLHRKLGGNTILAGERQCVPPEGFDLGNSPGDFTPGRVKGRPIVLSTTNGTKAILAARGAAAVFVAAFVNRAATAQALRRLDRPVTLLCAGTDGQSAPEDEMAAGAVAEALGADLPVASLFTRIEPELPAFLERTPGGRNVIAAGLGVDLGAAGRVDAFSVVARARFEGEGAAIVEAWQA